MSSLFCDQALGMASGRCLLCVEFRYISGAKETGLLFSPYWIKVTEKYRKDGSALIDHVKFPEITISVHTETGQAEEEIAVPLQRNYTGTKPVISSSLADTPCTTLRLLGLLERLNTTLGTSHILDTPVLSSLLEDCIAKNYDFGIAYGFLRPAWYTEDWSSIPDKIRECEEKDVEMRRGALHGSDIVAPYICPRRAWDLYSNRVVPMWTTGEEYPHGISHAWVDEEERTEVWTPINGRKWPVPIPKDTNLDLIRIELLNKGLEYVWLDVLCLRQERGPREDLRVEEWKLDVPTIGGLYRWSKVQCYLSGLGRPLSVEQGYFDTDRCWFNRAWTLQEIGQAGYEICGVTPDGPLNARADRHGKYDPEVLTTFHEKLRGLQRLEFQPFDALEEMQHRVSTKPVDRIAAMAILLWPCTIPAYYESQSLEGAWTALVNTVDEFVTRAALFFWYPEPGNAGAKWRPSWDQVMTTPLPRDYTLYIQSVRVERDAEANVDQCEETCCIENGFVRGLAEGGALGTDRHGELLVEDTSGIQHGFPIIATHQYPIPEDMYTLIRNKLRRPERWVQWVVGRRLSDKRFEKLSVFKMDGHTEYRMYDDISLENRVNILA
ncbi:uncharacterized protein ARMOST_16130 [Armillaria ostoyae]|uniref:Heterokaryon incompatibility domain-containing protein n=1 Tax=Armillaria ostoyae TaxID=47428 RepID=A0A284RVB7_ARMOS|nr:uncharacterized protein ARMOST_16130 [Armillaria ostoyae]